MKWSSSSPEQVLPALAGNWKGAFTQKIYGGKPDIKKLTAVAHMEWIVGKKWLRQRVHMPDGGFVALTSFDPDAKTFREWFFHANGLIFGPSAGRWDSATRTMTFTNLPDDKVVLVTTWRFVDAETLISESVIRDKEGKTLFEMAIHLKRTAEILLIDETATAGLLPKEMEVLGRVVGEWQTTAIRKDAESPNGFKHSWQKTTRPILGGRVIATRATGLRGDEEAYWLSTFDTFSKAYGFWMFKSDGAVLDHGGLWDEKTQTMKWHWAAKDGSQSTSHWQLREPGRCEWHVVTKNALGTVTSETEATSVRVAEPGWVQLFNGNDLKGWNLGKEKSGAWHVENGAIVGKGHQAWLMTDRTDFRDFHLRMQAKYVNGSAQLILRGQGERSDKGYWLYLNNGKGNLNTGALLTNVDSKAHSTIVKEERTKPGEWFTVEVIAKGKHFQTLVNGEKALDWTDPAPINVTQGSLRLYVLGKDAELHVKSIDIKELPAEATDWTKLFNGKDLDGWTHTSSAPVPPWKIDQGILEAVGKDSLLVSKRKDFGDFHLRMELMSDAQTKAHLLLRADAAASDGYRMELGIAGTERTPGSIFRDLPVPRGRSAADGLVEPNEWFTLEVIAQGNRFIVKQDGKIALDWTDDRWVPERGAIALRQVAGSGLLKIRRFEIKALPTAR